MTTATTNLKEVVSAHHLKYLLIAILEQQRASHTACLQRKVYSTQLGSQKNVARILKRLFSETTNIPHTTYIPQHIS